MIETFPCWIYKSPIKNEMYLYVAEEDGFGPVPESLLRYFGEPVFVMELTLHTQRKLAREDVAKVMTNLTDQGFHLQMPPDLKPNMYYGNQA